MLKKLFVYGTLRHDMGRAALTPVGTLVGAGQIKGSMFDLRAFPAVIPSDTSLVDGQVLSFEDLGDEEWKERLRRFDIYEGVPNLYIRDTTEVTMKDGTVEEAWVYLFARPGRFTQDERVPSGDWKQHVATRDAI